MKKFIKLFVAIFACVALLSFGFFTACNSEKLSGEMKVVIVNDETSTTKEYTVDLSNFTSSQHVSDVIKYLTSTEEFYYKGTTSIYGIYLTEMGTTTQAHNDEYNYDYEVQTPILKEDGSAKKYIYVYTTVKESADETQSKQFDDVTAYAASTGVSGMELTANSTIYFTYIIY
jgi:hypothetical protein